MTSPFTGNVTDVPPIGTAQQSGGPLEHAFAKHGEFTLQGLVQWESCLDRGYQNLGHRFSLNINGGNIAHMSKIVARFGPNITKLEEYPANRLSSLQGLPNLTKISIKGSPAEVEAFQKTHPHIEVTRLP